MREAFFELADVHFSYLGKFPALCGLNIKITQGEKVAIIGANGTGKSTLFLMLDALIFPDKGAIKAFGRDLKEEMFNDEQFSRFFRSKVGFVFQNPDVQLFCPTVREDITFGPLQLGVSGEETRKRLDKLTAELDIAHLLDRSPHQLSIGEKRKIAIASVLAVDPEVIILDEPTAGLDPLTTRHVIDIIMKANLDGKTIITATHDLQIIEEISDCVHVFDRNKRITRCGNAGEILADTVFLQDNNLVHIHKHHHGTKAHVHPHNHTDHHH
jgi:cobalt/nickel transport system ATP-binding protein